MPENAVVCIIIVFGLGTRRPYAVLGEKSTDRE
jgi:hypothetical protein